ncbi:hypothetical protein KP509_17G064700 [Ceratopteris richardii]|uniref:Uncharacterized protein n=1 Tax=Ceratopteris richardii TaxID=49495 RepID=A0A8T2SYX4_CERRI|nr:hypothetical protein KP509_17G064700 [Ceratopteris richardii]
MDLVGLRKVSEVISMGMNTSNVGGRTSALPSFHCHLAISNGRLEKEGVISEIDEDSKIAIAGTTRSVAKLVREARMKGNNVEWSELVATMCQSPLLEPCNAVINRSEKSITKGKAALRFDIGPEETLLDEVSNTESQNKHSEPYDNNAKRENKESDALKFGGSPNDRIFVTPHDSMVTEVDTWFQALIGDKDILKETEIGTNVIARIVAESEAQFKDLAADLRCYEWNNEWKVLDIGVLRYPDPDHPLFKVYRIQLTAWSACKRTKFNQSYSNGITGEFSCREYRPRVSVIAELAESVRKQAVHEAEAMFGNPNEQCKDTLHSGNPSSAPPDPVPM